VDDDSVEPKVVGVSVMNEAVECPRSAGFSASQFGCIWSKGMQSVASVRALEDYELEVTFDDGVCGVVSLKDRLFGPVFEPLRDPAMFRQVSVDEFGAICCPNGADLAPDGLYEKLRAATATA
jgi:hypothetical protein